MVHLNLKFQLLTKLFKYANKYESELLKHLQCLALSLFNTACKIYKLQKEASIRPCVPFKHVELLLKAGLKTIIRS